MHGGRGTNHTEAVLYRNIPIALRHDTASTSLRGVGSMLSKTSEARFHKTEVITIAFI
jgi:hypothetical protein